jgi:hypothetical protein
MVILNDLLTQVKAIYKIRRIHTQRLPAILQPEKTIARNKAA